MSATLSPRGRVILVVGAATGLATGYAGLFFSTLTVFLKPMATSFGWSRADASVIVMMSLLGVGMGAPFTGIIIDRWGARRVIGGSILLFVTGIVALSYLPDNRLLFAGTGFLIGLITVALGPGGYLCVLPPWFDRRLGLALSCAMAGVGIGSVVMPTLTLWLIPSFGWRGTYRVLAVVALIGGGLGWLALGVGERGSVAKAVAEGEAPSAPLSGDRLGTVLRDRRFWTLIGILFIGAASGLGGVVHLAPMLDDRHVPPDRVAAVAGMVGLGLMLGRLVGGVAMDRMFAPLVAIASYVLGALGLLLIGFGTDLPFAALLFGGALLGLALGTEGDFVAFVVRRYFGSRHYASIFGLLFAAYSFGGVCGPVLFGIGFDRLGNYQFAMAVAAIGFVCASALALTLGRYRYPARAA